MFYIFLHCFFSANNKQTKQQCNIVIIVTVALPYVILLYII